MKEKLMKKWFQKDLIEEKLHSSSEEIEYWENYEDEIKRKIEDSLAKGKSLMVIELLLTRKYPYFKKEIRESMEWKRDTLWLEKEIQRYRSKYDISDFKQKAKFYAALERKWFHYKEIQSFLDAENEHE
jgi:SOS response regulatory protein OraA/RecX